MYNAISTNPTISNGKPSLYIALQASFICSSVNANFVAVVVVFVASFLFLFLLGGGGGVGAGSSGVALLDAIYVSLHSVPFLLNQIVSSQTALLLYSRSLPNSFPLRVAE